MLIVFSQPAALWLLAALPVLTAIYFLQQKSRIQEVSTLFLLQRQMDQTRGGARMRYLRSSWPLLLQLLALTALAFLLAGPTVLDASSKQRVTVVLDESGAMAAFRQESLELLRERARGIAAMAGLTEWQVLGSSRPGKVIYRGDDTEKMLAAVESQWSPALASHETLPTLRAVRTATSAGDAVMFLTHSNKAVPPGVVRLSAATARENVAIVGYRFDEEEREVLRLSIRNFSGSAQSRRVALFAAGQTLRTNEIVLNAEGMAEVAFTMPAGSQGDYVIRMSPEDALALDDVLPLVVPQKKVLRVGLSERLSQRQRVYFERVLKAVSDVMLVAQDEVADLIIRAGLSQDDQERGATVAEIVVASDLDLTVSTEFAPVVASGHSLVRHLSFQRLRVPEVVQSSDYLGDEVLLWCGNFPLASLRTLGQRTMLKFMADPSDAIGSDDAAMFLLFVRYLEFARSAAPGPFAENFLTDALLPVRGSGDAFTLTVRLPGNTASRQEQVGRSVRAPPIPSHWELREGKSLLIRGSSQFLDASLSDLRNCVRVDESGGVLGTAVKRNYREFAQGWMVLVAVLMFVMGAWYAQTRV